MKQLLVIFFIVTQTFAIKTQCNKVDPVGISDLFSQERLIYSGYLNVISESESALAYLFYGQESVTEVAKLKDYPTLIWLNGLLGESSQIGNFLEIGPLRLNEKGILEKNINTWNKNFNLLFVDLVVGTGYSYHSQNSDIPQNSEQLVDQFVFAIEQFLTNDNGCVKKQGFEIGDLYIFGEGYAAKQIVNIAAKESSLKLKGIGLGNAHIDPISLLAEVPSYASNMGLVEPNERAALEKLALRGVKQIQNQQFLDAHNTIRQAISLLYQYSGGINIQNIDQLSDNEIWMSKLAAFLKDPQTIINLKFDPSITFKYSAPEIIAALSTDFPTVKTLPNLKIVSTKVKVLVYTGQNDVLCPITSTLRYLSQIIDDFKTQPLKITKLEEKNNRIIGYHMDSGKLRYQSINNAGFHVPLDKGEEILNIVNNWLK